MDEVVSHLVYARCHDTNTFFQDQEMLRAFNWCFHFTGYYRDTNTISGTSEQAPKR